MEYFGALRQQRDIAANLDAALATSLGQIPDGVSKNQGIRYGERAAERLIELRADDGRFARSCSICRLAPGVWRPTPPAIAPFFDPWLGQVDPFVLDSPSQFGPVRRLRSPPTCTSRSSRRSATTASTRFAPVPEQTETALFFSDIGVGPLQAGLRDLVTRRDWTSATARACSRRSISAWPTRIAVWDAKFRYGWWRPITAIREADTDGNPEHRRGPRDGRRSLSRRPIRTGRAACVASSVRPAGPSHG